MMEVGSSSVQSLSRARHTEHAFGPEARSPSVDTGLSLGVPGENKGASTGLSPPVSKMPVPLSNTIGDYPTTAFGSLIRDEAPFMSSSGRTSGFETFTVSPLGTVDGNQTTSASPPDNLLPPSIPTASFWTTPTLPQNPPLEPSLPNAGTAKEFGKGVLWDVDSKNVDIPSMTAPPLHNEAMKVDVDDLRLDMVTPPSHLAESQPSQADLNNRSYGGETQFMHDSQIGETDKAHPAFASESQRVDGNERFDGTGVLQSDTHKASTMPMTTAGQSISHGTDAQPLLDSFSVPAFTLSNSSPASYLSNVSIGERETPATAEGSNIVPTLNEHLEVYPAETAEQLGLMQGKEETDTITFEPRPVLDENVDGKTKADEKSVNGVAEIDTKDDVNQNAKIVCEQDIQAIKGSRVVKEFGRKTFEGVVVGYDAENQWFKVVYEDGDEEDLDLLEVKKILLNADTSTNASAAKRKRSQPEGTVHDQQARKQKVTAKKKSSTAGTWKKPRQGESSPRSKTRGLKGKAKSERSAASAHGHLGHSQPASGAKRKRISDAKVMTSRELESETIGRKVNSKENKESSGAKAPRKVSAKGRRGRATAEKVSAKKKGTRHRNVSKLPTAAVEAGEGDQGGKHKGKRRKVDASKDQDSLVGKAVKKKFGGTLYSGVVVEYDKKTEYYRVKYEDGDQEDLELEELKAVLAN